MAVKKKTTKKAAPKSTMVKIAEKVGEVAGKISVQKDHLVEMADHAIESVRSTIHDFTAKKPAVKKAVKKIVKKASPAAVKKTAKKTVNALKKATAKSPGKKKAKK